MHSLCAVTTAEQMLRDEPTIKTKRYRLPQDPLIEDVLIPSFRQARRVRGAFGWFSAGWIPVLAHGLAAYLMKPDTEPMQMVVSPALFPEDMAALESADSARQLTIARFEEVLSAAGGVNGDVLARHAVDCLAWMYAQGKLDLRIAVPLPGSNYHPKIWEFSDGTDVVCVLGSANATGRAFHAAEHMDVDCSWDRIDHVNTSSEMIDDWWGGRDPGVLRETVPLTEALSRKIIELAPPEPPGQENYQAALAQSQPTEPNWKDLGPKPIFKIPTDLDWRTGDYQHQGEAVAAWESASRRGILEMATGSGKTITSLIAAYRAHQEHDGPFLIVISVPTNALLDQWLGECERFGLTPVVPSRLVSSKRIEALANVMKRLRVGNRGTVETLIVTNNLLRNSDFGAMTEDESSRNDRLGLMLIGDEVHSLGTEEFLNNPPESFQFRLGLSATPDRQYDDVGTIALQEYFGKSVYEFGLSRAIGFCLVNYKYFVHVAHLNEREIEEYIRLSALIGKAMGMGDDEALKRNLILRRRVLENAVAKIDVLREILKGKHPKFLLVYVSAKDPTQMESAREVMGELGIDSARVTQEESAKPAKLKAILASFAKGDVDVLLAKKVLDEGVDIPATREAILVASSTVEREWIQRRGRVLRRYPGKEIAIIHDIIALPPPGFGLEGALISAVESECNRVRAFAEYAQNAVEVFATIEEILSGYAAS